MLNMVLPNFSRFPLVLPFYLVRFFFDLYVGNCIFSSWGILCDVAKELGMKDRGVFSDS